MKDWTGNSKSTFTTLGAMCYAWFVWEKGYKGLPEIDWIN